jgi:nucleoside phosphorylase
MSLPRFEYGDYTIGWICALPKEMTAATAMLDSFHENLPKLPADNNNYNLGSMGEFNIAIASLPSGEIGSHLASACVTRMLATFPKMTIGFMVGIGGGVPSKENDVRLGDVVVSVPANGYGGVVHHDMGKNTKYGGWVQTGSLNGPPSILRTTITKLRSFHDIRRHKIESHLSEMIQRYPHLHPRFTRQAKLTDVLYEPEPEDPGAFSGWVEVQRSPRPPHETIKIHYGLIASGNQVIKTGRLRDQISSRYGGVLCFEMEAAGLMNELPCVVIRGICDYADAHKNKEWQEYAAAVAAAYAKELILTLPVAVPTGLGYRGAQAVVLEVSDHGPLAAAQNEAVGEFSPFAYTPLRCRVLT